MAHSCTPFLWLLLGVVAVSATNLVYLPLDERFATRGCFLRITQIADGLQVLSPPLSLLPSLKKAPNQDALISWTSKNMAQADDAVISLEMLIYGGLITSRSSMDSVDLVVSRFNNTIAKYIEMYPNLRLSVSTVIMRIPSYDGDTEEPAYWAKYGRLIYQYSFYQDRYDVLHNADDLAQANKYKAQIPGDILSEFLWRRQRNMAVIEALMALQRDTHALHRVYITLDDNAEWGFNKAEERTIRGWVAQWGLGKDVFIYPGADEVALLQVAELLQTAPGARPAPRICPLWRLPQYRDRIPSYEGQAFNISVATQIQAVGGIVASTGPNDCLGQADLALVVNNFDKEGEAPDQQATPSTDYDGMKAFLPIKGRTAPRYWGKGGTPLGEGPHPTGTIPRADMFRTSRAAPANVQGWGVVDKRYANGGDLSLVKWMAAQPVDMTRVAFAAWNTAGNSLGTVLAQMVLAYLYPKGAPQSLDFTAGRLVEDVAYMASARNMLCTFLNMANEEYDSLGSDPAFYSKFTTKALQEGLKETTAWLGIGYTIDQLYYPWNRTFEIGFNLRRK
ncbi:hypothetical protein PAPYR_4337 [Paratrimastix pyriformis]|uniref:Uncharacterized protein n=1 Tax=Paratrimastix pyriformis TaxID=342808 RepID=A0ABQ8UMB5_9EUKA|nr:hypothetical protein PAPYR_4337 [Paratrimastix pyriformis]